jgi:hypothetical protein
MLRSTKKNRHRTFGLLLYGLDPKTELHLSRELYLYLN